ncbi:hypothetical protein MHYP_G00254410 [Metynnis hypsauchen]
MLSQLDPASLKSRAEFTPQLTVDGCCCVNESPPPPLPRTPEITVTLHCRGALEKEGPERKAEIFHFWSFGGQMESATLQLNSKGSYLIKMGDVLWRWARAAGKQRRRLIWVFLITCHSQPASLNGSGTSAFVKHVGAEGLALGFGG